MSGIDRSRLGFPGWGSKFKAPFGAFCLAHGYILDVSVLTDTLCVR